MVLVFQAYGREDVIRQTFFSMTTLLKVVSKESPLQIWVYTDHYQVFANFLGRHAEGEQPRVKIIEINAAQIQKWRGAINFVHRVKVEILIDAGKKMNGPLFYVDGDTYFREDPTPLFMKVNDKVSLMHVAENALDQGRDPLSKKIKKFVKNNSFVISGAKVQMPISTVMYNAGALGVSQKNKELLPLVLEMTDKTFSLYAKHIMEQLAFSYYLQTRTQIIAADQLIGHYWNQKPEFQEAIDAFLTSNKTVDMALQNFMDFSWPGPVKPKVKKSHLLLNRISNFFRCRNSSEN